MLFNSTNVMPINGLLGASAPLELWAGAECTVNRVEDEFRDQLRETGHHDRLEDFDLIADLGITALRFPVLWERVSQGEEGWSWSDIRLDRLRQARIRPIVGLIHHGSGPAHTSLVDDSFALGLAAHALAAARRYPWIGDWTPVNEPLTTARFACLYGHWYPHERDERAFWRALLNQVEATCMAMQAIRSVNPAARLIQTEDLGRTYATAAMADQAAFDNSRRWLTWDLLSGRVRPGHSFWGRLCAYGFEKRLRALIESPCPPDVIGINHYVTSDRFLDHRTQRYPAAARGANAVRAFADVEAVRVLNPAPQGLRGALQEAWDRYRQPLAVTEVHIGCTREEQLRWLAEAWQTATDLRDRQIDVRAVTAWALFGSQGWNTLLTAPGVYESGAYDVTSARPRPTAVSSCLSELVRGRSPAAAARPGWWRRDIRFTYPAENRAAPMREHGRAAARDEGAPLLILGATGTLGRAVAAACRNRELPFALTNRNELDLGDAASIAVALDRHRPQAVINAAGWVRVDDAEREAAACFAANADGASALAEACHARGIASVSFSSDLVFDDTAAAFGEGDVPSPLNVYGRSKRRMEERILALGGRHLVVRTAAFFSPHDEHNFAAAVIQSLRQGLTFTAAHDRIVSPTYVPDLCNALLDLVIDGEAGIWHLTNAEAVDWAEFARRIARACRLDEALIEAVPAAELGWAAMRPKSCALLSLKGCRLPPLGSAIERFADHVRTAGSQC